MKISIGKNGFVGVAALALSLMAGAAAPATFAAADAKDAQKNAQTEPKPYPLTTCIVTDNDLGSMGEETSIVYEGQVIKFCCAPCERKFLKNPAKYLAKLSLQAAK